MLLLFGLLCFCYVICIFGPYESSIRLRLIRDIYERQGPSVSWADLTQTYNDEIILKIRLDRLAAAGDLTFDGTRYQIRKKQNIFSFLARISRVMKKMYGYE